MKKPSNWLTRISAKIPGNKYKFQSYCVDVFQHQGRVMTPAETNFISCVQRTDLPGLALLLVLYENNPGKLELFRIAMKFHVYKDDFEPYLQNNKHDPRVKKAIDVCQLINNGRNTLKA